MRAAFRSNELAELNRGPFHLTRADVGRLTSRIPRWPESSMNRLNGRSAFKVTQGDEGSTTLIAACQSVCAVHRGIVCDVSIPERT
jgi:hypothetical protein